MNLQLILDPIRALRESILFSQDLSNKDRAFIRNASYTLGSTPEELETMFKQERNIPEVNLDNLPEFFKFLNFYMGEDPEEETGKLFQDFQWKEWINDGNPILLEPKNLSPEFKNEIESIISNLQKKQVKANRSVLITRPFLKNLDVVFKAGVKQAFIRSLNLVTEAILCGVTEGRRVNEIHHLKLDGEFPEYGEAHAWNNNALWLIWFKHTVNPVALTGVRHHDSVGK